MIQNPTTIGEVDERFQLARECDDTRRRALAGGLFYFVGWILLCAFGDVFPFRVPAALAIGFLFAALAVLRFVLAARPADDARQQRRLLAAFWAVFIVTSVLWGVISGWAFIDPAFAPARTAAVICTVAFATAYAHTWGMRWRLALIGIALLLLPVLVLVWSLPSQRPVAIVLAVYCVYLMSALRQNHREYHDHLRLEAEVRQQRDQFEQQSRTDALTGLNNRREFSAQLVRTFESDEPVSLLVIDLDHFKRVNDRYGHAAGDACLISFADQLRAAFDSRRVLLARVGGEEFAVLMRDTTLAEAQKAADQFRGRLSLQGFVAGADPMPLTVSMGVGERDSRRHGNPDEFLSDVDRALYRAKSEGRDRICVAADG